MTISVPINQAQRQIFEQELPALLNVLDQLREAIRAGKYRRVSQLLEDLDDFMAMVAVAGEATRPWKDFIVELDADVPNPDTK